jgi:hypothetical protein
MMFVGYQWGLGFRTIDGGPNDSQTIVQLVCVRGRCAFGILLASSK